MTNFLRVILIFIGVMISLLFIKLGLDVFFVKNKLTLILYFQASISVFIGVICTLGLLLNYFTGNKFQSFKRFAIITAYAMPIVDIIAFVPYGGELRTLFTQLVFMIIAAFLVALGIKKTKWDD